MKLQNGESIGSTDKCYIKYSIRLIQEFSKAYEWLIGHQSNKNHIFTYRGFAVR